MLAVVLALLSQLALPLHAFGEACLFSGDDVLCLKQNLDLNGVAKILSGSGAPAATPPAGSLYLRTDLGTLYQYNGSSWSVNEAASHDAVTLGTANGLSLVGQQLSLGLASSGVAGALSGSDWTAFNNKQAKLGDARNVYVGFGTYATVQAAVTHAETLAGSDSADTEGVTVHIPGGYFNETVTIRKNVNLKGAGRNATKIQAIVYRPGSSSSGPAYSYVQDIDIQSLTVSNETAALSGIYYSNMAATYRFTSVRVNTASLTNAQNIEFYNSEVGDGTATGFVHRNANVLFLAGYIQGITNECDDNHAGKIAFNTCNLFLYTSHAPGEVIITTISSVTEVAYLASKNSYIGFLTENDNTASNIQGGSVFDRVLNGATHLGSTYNSYAPFVAVDSTHWSPAPTTVDSALDQLASRVKTIETAPVLPSHSKASLPAATPAGKMIYVTDEIGGAIPAFSDGTNWRRVTDRAIVN